MPLLIGLTSTDKEAEAKKATAADLTRKDRWHSLCNAIANTLPQPPVPETPVKVRNKDRKRVEDRSDPEKAEAPPALPLHTAVIRAMECLREDIPPQSDKGGIKIQRKPLDTTYIPKGQRYWVHPAELDENLNELQEGRMPTHTNFNVAPEKDLKQKEQMLRAMICYASSRRWIEDALFMSLDVMLSKPQEGVESWGPPLREMLLAMHSISVVEMDTLTTELANIVLLRREAWIKAMKPEPSRELVKELRNGTFLGEGLFGDVNMDTVEKELTKRKDMAIQRAMEQKVSPQFKPSAQPEYTKRAVTPTGQQGPPPKKAQHKKGQSGKKTPQQPQRAVVAEPAVTAQTVTPQAGGRQKGNSKGYKGRGKKSQANK